MSNLPLSWQRTLGAVLVTGAVVGGGVLAPTAAADWEDDAVDVGCDLGAAALSAWVKQASKIRVVGIVAGALAPQASKGCKWVLKKFIGGQPGTINVQTSRQTRSETIYFDDLVTDLPDSSAAPPSTATGQQVYEELMRDIRCGGWKNRAFFDMCVNGELEPVYR